VWFFDFSNNCWFYIFLRKIKKSESKNQLVLGISNPSEDPLSFHERISSSFPVL
jgi:hypothetical protein